MIELPLVQGRKCGDCRACCNVMAVEELGKPYYVDCEHLCDKGCSIYDTKPPTCGTYNCVWLQGCPLLAEEDRPDKCGILFNMEEDDHGIWIEGFPVRKVTEAEMKHAFDVAQDLFNTSSIPMRGVRFYRDNTVIATLFKLDTEKYPDEGEGGGSRDYKSYDGIVYMHIGPKRKVNHG